MAGELKRPETPPFAAVPPIVMAGVNAWLDDPNIGMSVFWLGFAGLVLYGHWAMRNPKEGR